MADPELSVSSSSAARSRIEANLLRSRAIETDRVRSRVSESMPVVRHGWRMTGLDLGSRRRFAGRVVSRVKRGLHRLLYPLPERQTEYNLAVSGVVAHLLDVVAEQSRAIDRLEDRVDRLEDERRGSG